MAVCPKCGNEIRLVKDKTTGAPSRIKCAKQETKKVGANFKEVGECDFKIEFKTKLHNLNVDEMRTLLDGNEIDIGDGNTMKLDLKEKFFTKITFGEKYEEEAF